MEDAGWWMQGAGNTATQVLAQTRPAGLPGLT
jgi:hypothetical protein